MVVGVICILLSIYINLNSKTLRCFSPFRLEFQPNRLLEFDFLSKE